MASHDEQHPRMQTCVECESEYVAATSTMYELCPECAHHIYGYPNCEHAFDAGRCTKCRWDGSRSKYIRTLIATQTGERLTSEERSRRSAPRTTEANRDLITRQLLATVRDGYGRWADGPTDELLGAPVFEFQDTEICVRLWERGLTYESPTTQIRARYADVERFEAAGLRELSAAKSAVTRGAAHLGVRVTCSLTVGADISSLSLPVVIYTSICKPLNELLQREPDG